MNERIKQLVAQAEDYASEYEEHWHDGPDWQELFSTKFAALIVKECAEICDQQGRVGWNDDRKAQARLDRDLIKEHFGVEE